MSHLLPLIPFYLSRADWYIYPANNDKRLFSVLQYSSTVDKSRRLRDASKDRIYFYSKSELLNAAEVESFLADSAYYYVTLQLLQQINSATKRLHIFQPHRKLLGAAIKLSILNRKNYYVPTLVVSDNILAEIFSTLNATELQAFNESKKKQLVFIYLQSVIDGLLAYYTERQFSSNYVNIQTYCNSQKEYKLHFFIRRIADEYITVNLVKSYELRKYRADNATDLETNSVRTTKGWIYKIYKFFKSFLSHTSGAVSPTYKDAQIVVNNNHIEPIETIHNKLAEILQINSSRITLAAAMQLLRDAKQFMDNLLNDLYLFLYEIKDCLKTLIHTRGALFSVVDIFELTLGELNINSSSILNNLIMYLALNVILQLYYDSLPITATSIYKRTQSQLILQAPKTVLDVLFGTQSETTISIDWFIILLLLQLQRGYLITYDKQSANSSLLDLLNKAYRRFAYFVWLIEDDIDKLSERNIKQPAKLFVQNLFERKQFAPASMF